MKRFFLSVSLLSLVGCASGGGLKLSWTPEEIAAYRAKHPDCIKCTPEALKKDMEEHPAFYRNKGACQKILKDRDGRIYLGC